MLAVQGYYDGTAIQTLEKINARPNQRVIITIMDEFLTPAINAERKSMRARPNQRVIITIMDEFLTPAINAERKSMRGVLAQFADPTLAEKEKGAWESAVVKKYGNV